METTFKVGDRVRIVQRKKGNHTGYHDWQVKGRSGGDIGKIGFITGMNSEGVYVSPVNVVGTVTSEYYGCFDVDDLVLVSGSKAQKPAKFILTYMRDSDPTEEFATLPEVKKRIGELLKDSSVRRDSFKVYEIKKAMTVSVRDLVVFKSVIVK